MIDREPLIGADRAPHTTRVPFRTVFFNVLEAADVATNQVLCADIYKRNRKPSGGGLEIVWVNEAPSKDEQAARELFPKAVIEYGVQNEVSLEAPKADAVLGHVAVVSETLTTKEISSILNNGLVVLRCVLSEDPIA